MKESPVRLPRRGERAGHLRGRQPDAPALEAVRALIGQRPADGHARELLLEFLHRLNDRFGALFPSHLAALAHEMRLGQAEVFEVASFYHHFEVLRDGQAAPALTVRVCEGLSCEMAGARDLLARLPALLGPGVKLVAAPCIGRCEQAPAALVGQRAVGWATPEAIASEARALLPLPLGEGGTSPRSANAVAAEATSIEARALLPLPLGEGGGEGQGVGARCPHPNPLPAGEGATPIGYAAYRAAGGYALAVEVASGRRDAESVIATLEHAGLRGLGGAGFPAGRKWRAVKAQPGPRLMVVNIDEGEPGTFKDRTLLERDPHRFLEGALIAASVVGAQAIYLYLRDEYHDARRLLEAELDKLRSDPPFPLPQLHLRRGAGAYICGEESALIESLEGKRGEPRLRPPYIAERGLFGRPTLAHNLETLHWVRELLEQGPEGFAAQGRHGRSGLRRFSVSGRVREPGVKLAPAGITLRELVDEYCGGMAEGHELYAYLPGGASGGILPARLADLPLDFDTLQPHGCFIGSAAVIVLGHRDRARDAALSMMRFFAHESCGQCTPCRVGTDKAARLMESARWDRATLDDLSAVMADASICGLGQAAPNPVRCVLEHFSHEVD